MAEKTTNDSLMEIFIFETGQLMDELEQLVIRSEKTNNLMDAIHEIFRIMHTVKGSAAMMQFNHMAELSHAVEDLFYYLREKRPPDVNYEAIGNFLLDAVDFIKGELAKIENGKPADGQSADKIVLINAYLTEIKTSNGEVALNQGSATKLANTPLAGNKRKTPSKYNGLSYHAVVFFEDVEMVDIRAFGVVREIMEIGDVLNQWPENLSQDNPENDQLIRKNGVKIDFRTTMEQEAIQSLFGRIPLVSKFELEMIAEKPKDSSAKKTIILDEQERKADDNKKTEEITNAALSQNQAIISVKLAKTDRLMNLMGEMVIAEALVTQNPDLRGLKLTNFQKAARLLRKITFEMQDAIMSIRMVPLTATFQKMNRLVRDMGKKIENDVVLKISGEETEVDKNIIDHISDPLMHLVRNAIDHGIETAEERTAQGKPKAGTIFLEARNAGKDVLIVVKDDGKGLNKQKILQKASERGLLFKPETEMSDREIYNLIFIPGFSTKDNVTEFSGRGVGLDVVVKNIEKVGGAVAIDSMPGVGTTMTMKIPLTLAIIDGMNVLVGQARYTLPTIAIKESFRPKAKDIIRDPDGNEMVMVRGECLSILRLHEYFKVKTEIRDLTQGILIMVEHNEKSFCLFLDKLLGQQQVVVKALPDYLKVFPKIQGLAGCTLLGDGSISLILDVGGMVAVAKSV